MFPKPGPSLITALFLLSAAAVPGARAASDDERARPSTNEEVSALETDNPHSVEYQKRMASKHSPTNDEIDADETDNPNSVDNPTRMTSQHHTTNDEINAGERGNPDRIPIL